MNGPILIVEDDALAALALRERLAEWGYAVADVIDCADAVLPAVSLHKPSVVLMDINLNSFIDGIDTAGRIQMISKADIIFITAYGDDTTRARADRQKPVAYLTKPVDAAELRRVLSTIQADTI